MVAASSDLSPDACEEEEEEEEPGPPLTRAEAEATLLTPLTAATPPSPEAPSGSASRPKRERLAGLDGIRGVLALTVCVSHIHGEIFSYRDPFFIQGAAYAGEPAPASSWVASSVARAAGAS